MLVLIYSEVCRARGLEGLFNNNVRVSVGCFTPYRQLGAFSWRKQVLT